MNWILVVIAFSAGPGAGVAMQQVEGFQTAQQCAQAKAAVAATSVTGFVTAVCLERGR